MRSTLVIISIISYASALQIPSFLWWLATPSKLLEQILPSSVMNPIEDIQKKYREGLYYIDEQLSSINDKIYPEMCSLAVNRLKQTPPDFNSI